MNQPELFIEKKYFDACIKTIDENNLQGRSCFVGFDFSSPLQVCSYVMFFPSAAGRSTAIFRNFHPDQNNEIIVLEYVWDQIMADARKFNFKKIVFDRWCDRSIENSLRDVMTCDFVQTSLSFASMNFNTQRLKSMIERGMIDLCDATAFDLYIVKDEAGNIKPHNKNCVSAFHGMAALLFAFNAVSLSPSSAEIKMRQKIKTFNLLPITASMVLFLKETFPEVQNVDSFDYVKFHQGQPYFYSKPYIEEHTADELFYAFSAMYLRE
jgi:phage terminase large subunit-like protein